MFSYPIPISGRRHNTLFSHASCFTPLTGTWQEETAHVGCVAGGHPRPSISSRGHDGWASRIPKPEFRGSKEGRRREFWRAGLRRLPVEQNGVVVVMTILATHRRQWLRQRLGLQLSFAFRAS